jgi:hypothetical protein
VICARATWRVDSVGAHREGRRLKWLSTRASMLYIVISTPVCVTVTVLCAPHDAFGVSRSRSGKTYGNMPYRPREAVEPVLRLFCYFFVLRLAGAQL